MRLPQIEKSTFVLLIFPGFSLIYMWVLLLGLQQINMHGSLAIVVQKVAISVNTA